MITTVIINWNGRADTLACIESLQHSTVPMQILVVDNGSTDGSGSAIVARYPSVRVMALPENGHFVRAANAGLAAARAAGATTIWLLNNDTVIASDALAAKLAILDSQPDVGIVGARLRHPQNPPGVIVGANCDFRSGAINEPVISADSVATMLEVDYVWGCAMLIRAELLDAIDPFETRWIAYFEDADFCLRARAAGWRTVTALRADVFHVGSKSANRRFLQQMWLRGLNWWRCFWRHAPREQRPILFVNMWFRRLPHLVWSTLVTIVVRKIRPNGRPIKLWSAR